MSIPSEKHIISFLSDSEEPVLQRDLGKAFSVKGEDRRRFRNLLADLVKVGKIQKSGKSYSCSGKRPSSSYTSVVITAQEDDAFIGVSLSKKDSSHEPQTYLIPDPKEELEIGYKALVRFGRDSTSTDVPPVAHLVRLLKASDTQKIVGIFCSSGEAPFLQPLSKKDRREYPILPSKSIAPQQGDLVEVEISEEGRHRCTAHLCRIVHAAKDSTLRASDLAIYENNLPHHFSEKAQEQANAAGPPTLEGREDLRNIPFVTIDDEDAKDFDDAVYARPDDAPDNPEGWLLWVAIADVAYYVASNTPLDQEAQERGNSVYFPDRVVPMLPEALSNELCSLKPEVDRACLAVSMRITKPGKLIDHRFTRGLMRSAKRLTYNQVQKALDQGTSDPISGEFFKDVIRPLHGAYLSLKKGRHHRGVLELNLEEQKLTLDKEGKVTGVKKKERLSSHQLIEEFMVLANVAAAKTLNDAGLPCLFRVHDQPTPEKVETLRNFLKLMSIDFKKGQKITPKLFNSLLQKVVGNPQEQAVNELVLRSQAQAAYTPDNIGHFGLGLARYAHFTSPIRRYADLLVHRALLHHLSHQKPKSFGYSHERFAEIGEHLSQTERQAAKAERDTKDRLVSQYLSDKQDEVFEGRLSGVFEKGLFITLVETGGDAFLPLRLLPHDYYVYDAKRQALIGKRTKRSFQLGDRLKVRLVEANPITGNLIVTLEQTLAPKRKKNSPHQKSPRKKEQTEKALQQKHKPKKSTPRKK